MKLSRLAVATLFTAAILFGAKAAPSELSVTCLAGESASGCNAGQVTFSGTDFPHNVHVLVVDDGGNVTDDFDYVAPRGELSFTESFFPGTYHATVSFGNGKNSDSRTVDVIVE